MPEIFPGADPKSAAPPPAASSSRPPRLPPAVDGIQVACCRNVACENFGVEPLPYVPRRRTPTGRVRARDGYRVVGHNRVRGWTRLRCTKCGEHASIKSNQGVKEELDRISDYLAPRPEPSCRNASCPAHGKGVRSYPELYRGHGRTAAGSPRWRCKVCGATGSDGKVGRVQRKSHENATVFRLLVNKSPIQAIARVAELSPQTVYDKIDFIHRQCLAFSAARERELSRLTVPRLWISCDRQDYVLNWSNTKDKRNTQLTAIGSADNRTGYVFGMHLNYDPDVDPVEAEARAGAAGDPQIVNPAFRRFARLWLSHDFEVAALRDPGRAVPARGRRGVAGRIAEAEEVRLAVDDPEALERVLETHQLPRRGTQVHYEYTVHAHFRLLRRLFGRARKVHFFMDQDDTLRAACLSAFAWDVLQGRVDAFYVQIDKSLVVDDRRKLVAASKREFARVRRTIGQPDWPDWKVRLFLVTLELTKLPAGKPWRERWLSFPEHTMHEPEKAVCHITDRGGYDLTRLGVVYSRASLHGIDRFFMQIRRMLSPLERPVATASNVRRLWHGYSPYDPAMVQKLLDIYRVYYNYVKTSRPRADRAGHRLPRSTPAMRLGLARGQVRIQDILDFDPRT